MTYEEELLFKDLCARIPTGVMLYCEVQRSDGYNTFKSFANKKLKGITSDGKVEVEDGEKYDLCNVKPYLRSFNLMSDKEKDKLQMVFWKVKHHPFSSSEFAGFDFQCKEIIEYCINHMLDYNGLIGMRLAREATEEMYNNI